MAANVTEAIVAFLEGAAPIADQLAGGLTAVEAPVETPLPYAIIEKADTEVLKVIRVGWGIEKILYRINVYAETGETAAAIAAQVKTALLGDSQNPAPVLVFDDGLDKGRWAAGGETVELDPDRGLHGTDVWAARLPLFQRVSHGS